MWQESEERVVDYLGLTVDRSRVRRVADAHFAANACLYPEIVDVP